MTVAVKEQPRRAKTLGRLRPGLFGGNKVSCQGLSIVQFSEEGAIGVAFLLYF